MVNVRTTLICLLLLSSVMAFSQTTEKVAVTFDELYDEPYSINKLFIAFQPLYGEIFATNVNAGYGVEAQYFHKNKFNIKAQFRKSYSSKFMDFNRENALQNSTVSNVPEVFNYFEFGGTYHIKDFDEASTTKIFLHRKKMTSTRWAATLATYAEVPSKLRKIYGARMGMVIWDATVDINRTLDKQNLSYANLINSENNSLPETYVDGNGVTQDMMAFSNLYSTNAYIGASLTWIRNIAVSFDKFDNAVDDGMFNVYFDVLFAPSMKLDPVSYNGFDYSTSAIKLNKIGARLGFEGKYNRTLGWSYGGELGYRPSLDGRGFFAVFKIAFPVFSSNLDNKVEAFKK
ncbi:MAG TPA: hypothetical protein PLM56_02130 [Cyclobacteriaceae bacterium]|jgi:hypothetical protein|nr:hypothetical protein [Cytophagales bacterium]HNT51528.1 hypothetical protein [Cyclobacteriaceae bacterium]HRE66041.1 hypothetical protein [Cyclobacteriaceae bacterium]HRF32269.1 hypothetical protein [Cyclobacteriaceae bacterium]